MTNSSSFFVLCVTLFYTLIYEVNSQEEALVFNYKTKQLEELRQFKDMKKDRYTSVVIACPAPSSIKSELGRINQQRSITGNGVFAQHIYDKYKSNNILKNICDTPLKPSLVEDTSTNFFETGYEVFNKETKETELLTKSLSTLKIDDGKTTKFDTSLIHPGEVWVFYWIPVLSIRASEFMRQINFSKDDIKESIYPEDYFSKCDDYNLSDESQKESSIKRLQKLDDILHISKNHDSDEEAPKLVKTQIVPLRYFRTIPAKLATCTELNLAYVWDSVALKLSKMVDLYIYSVYRGWPSQLNIIFGTTGLIKELQPNQIKEIKKPENLILEKFAIPVPEILYRILEYKRSESNIIHNVVIVTHNDLDNIPDEKRICSKESEVQSWEDMNHLHESIEDGGPVPLGLTYACRVTPETINKLGAVYEVTQSMETLILREYQRVTAKTNVEMLCILEVCKPLIVSSMLTSAFGLGRALPNL